MKELTKNNCLPANSRISQLSPCIDEHGILRSLGRLAKATVILCSRCSLSSWMPHALQSNSSYNTFTAPMDTGHEFSRSSVQQQFWILKTRKELRQLIRRCITCRRQQQDVIQPIMADLPKERLPSSTNFPFRKSRVDYLGPFFIKAPRAEKRYILLFTCLVTRAIHIEITEKLNTDELILAIRRFICRRGQPHSIRSDNATTFISANKAELEKLEKVSPDISARLGVQHIAWYFSPPATPHFGGAWERLIRSFKGTFFKYVGSRTLHDSMLYTFAFEVEAIMNNRPLLFLRTSPTWSLSHRIIYYTEDLKQSYRQVSSTMTRSPTAGRKLKLKQTVFGQGSTKNTWHLCKQDQSGRNILMN